VPVVALIEKIANFWIEGRLTITVEVLDGEAA
jgi:hypothetical protein